MRTAARTAKWAAIILLIGLPVLLILTGLVLTVVVDPNRYRGRIERAVADFAGRPFVIEGDLSIRWFPWLGVHMGPAHLNSHLEPGDPLAEWQSVDLAAKVLPLMRGQLVIDRIHLQRPHIRLHRDAQGRGNWEKPGPQASAGAGKPAGQGPPQIGGLEIRDGTVELRDEANGQRIEVSNLELDMGEWRAGETLSLHTRFLAKSGQVAPNGVWIQIDAPEVMVQPTPVSVSSPKLSVRIGEAQIKGDVAYEQTTRGQTTAHGSLTAHVPSVRTLANELALNQTMPHDPTTLGLLELTTQWSYSDGALAARPLAIKVDGVNLNGWVERTAAPASAWTFELHGDRIDLGRYAKIDSANPKPIELPVEMLRAINANGSLIFDQAQFADTHMTDVRLKVHTQESSP